MLPGAASGADVAVACSSLLDRGGELAIVSEYCTCERILSGAKEKLRFGITFS